MAGAELLDFNRSVMRAKRASIGINEAIDAAILDRASREPSRSYLGASSIGSECLRRIQWDWTDPSKFEARSQRIFARGHWFEDYASKLMIHAGFSLRLSGADGKQLGFVQAGGRFRGHVDGVVDAGPEIEGVGYPCLWECKCLGSSGWKQLESKGLQKAYPAYASQVSLYQAYLGLTEHPAIFSAGNADTMEIVHLLIPYDPERAQAASDRAVAVLTAVEHGELLPRVTDDPADWRCKFCQHREKCWS